MARKYCEENERVKRQYLAYLKQAKGHDQKSLDKVAAVLVKYEQSTKFKPFKAFHIEQAGKFKDYLANARHPKTGKPLSHATNDATLRLVKGFFHWLAGQAGYKSRISYSDVEYFNNNRKHARIAHAQRDVPFPTLEQAKHAFQAMPNGTDFEKRDKAVFAFFMLTGARVSAAATLKLKHINLFDKSVFQDGREVKTKNSKTFTSFFYPVDPIYYECFKSWVTYLREIKLHGNDDALFPKATRRIVDGKFSYDRLSSEVFANSGKLNEIIRIAFANVQFYQFTPHSFRKTHGLLMSKLRLTDEERKAWSQNLGHDNVATTISAYMPVSTQRQGELIKGL